MGETLIAITQIMGPVILCAGLGWGWSRLGKPCDTGSITQILVYVAVPCLILSTLTRLEIDPGEIVAMMAAALVAHILFLAAGWALLRALRMDPRTYLGAVAFGNTGNAGLPVCMLAFGDRGLALGLGFMLVNTIFLFTVGMWLPMGRRTLRPVLTTPVLYALALGLVLLFLDYDPPRIIAESLHIMAGMAIPLMLLALGMGLSRIRMTVANAGTATGLALAKAGINAATALALYYLLGLMGAGDAFRGVFALQCMMPSAVFVYLFAEMHDAEAPLVAGLVLASTLLALFTLPVVLAAVL